MNVGRLGAGGRPRHVWFGVGWRGHDCDSRAWCLRRGGRKLVPVAKYAAFSRPTALAPAQPNVSPSQNCQRSGLTFELERRGVHELSLQEEQIANVAHDFDTQDSR